MDLDSAILILKDYVNTDRQIRNHSIESDFDKFCETTCIAIETVLNELDN
jgi:hypothetical protein